MSETKIICISHKTYTLKDENLLKLAASNKFRYKFIPLVLYNKKTFGKEDLTKPIIISFNDYMPFTLYDLGVPIAILRSYIGKKNINKEDLNSAKKAFKELKNFALQCYERIIADLFCEIILKEIKEIKEESGSEHIIFFVERSASDKMLGRLASLYLNLDKVTICFLSFDASDLMTTVMSSQTGKLHFDIHRLMTTDIPEPLGPYPGDSEDSLIQTYFYKPSQVSEGEMYRPIRLDIFTQGLLRNKIEEKKGLIKEILRPRISDTYADGTSGTRSLMPVGFKDLKDVLEKQKKDIMQKLLEIEK